MNWEIFIAIRFLGSSRKRIFGRLVGWICVMGVAIGVGALIVTLSVMNGFRHDIESRILSLKPHLWVSHATGGLIHWREIEKRLKGIPGVMNTAPAVMGQAILKTRTATQGAVVSGILPDEEIRVTGIERLLPESARAQLSLHGSRAIAVGRELANSLNLEVSQEVVLISPAAFATPLGAMPRMEKFKVAAIFDSGYYEFDAGLAYIALAAAQDFFETQGRVSAIGVAGASAESARGLASKVQKELGWPLLAKSWDQMNRSLFAALKLEKTAMFIILTLIVVVAAFNIASMLVTLAVEKARQIGILRALGATPSSIQRIFLWQGGLIGLCGALGGVCLGLMLCEILKHYPLSLPSDIYYLDRLPVAVQMGDVSSVMLAAIAIALLAAAYPARRASSVSVCEALRND